MYAVGIDLGTTYTAAAIWRDGRAEVAALGGRGAAIPSVVLLREDETFLTGESANRRALVEPQRVAREFKRRLGDPTPIMLAGTPYSAEALTARLLRTVLDEVRAREGTEPQAICVCHPANWGPYKTDLLRQAIRMADLDQPVSLTTEPEAAAIWYLQQRPVEIGAAVAVYDLGGGTFDAAVLRRTESGFAILGHPEGIERLGGIDFDAAVFSHVARSLGGKLAELDETDPAVISAVGRLREECVEAKESLSSDTDVTIPVLLPNVTTKIRMTRSELEEMVRPALTESIDALRRAVRSAGLTPDQLHSVLLVGGSSRMPLVAQLVGTALGRPVSVDAHPKHAIALGAAWVASGAVSGAREVRQPRSASATATAAAKPAAPAAPVVQAAAGANGTAGAGAALAESAALAEPTALAEATALVTRPAERTSMLPPVADRSTRPAPRPAAEWPENYAADRTPSRYGDRTPPPSRYESDRAPVHYPEPSPPPAPRILAAILVGLIVGALVGMGILALLNR
ncbi:MAG: Hsp70 family protein [Sporichthyaceae bacterium]|nr:Hsp70 family protein [Sporichthyaceae bacterium]